MKHLFAALLLLVASALPVAAQMHRYNTGFTLSQQNFCDTVALVMDNDQLYVPVTIGGTTYRFCLDTGSSQGMLFFGTRVPIEEHLGSVISTDANGRKDTTAVVQLPPITLGHTTITGYVATMVRPHGARRSYDGIIGFDLFNKGLAAKIDPRAGQLILSDRRKAMEEEQGEVLKYKLVKFVPYVLVSPFMRHTDLALFDTGARQLYQMNREHFLDHRYKSRQVQAQVEGEAVGRFAVGVNGAEEPATVYFLHLDRLRWAGFTLANVRCITTQGDSRLGAQLFNYGSVVVRPKKKELVFQPYDGRDSVSVSNRQFGVAFIQRNNEAAIGLIWHKSEAYKKGMRQGDVVVTINNQPVATYQDFVDFPFADGQSYCFVLRDARGFKKEITITR